jgi:hypothetical protein
MRYLVFLFSLVLLLSFSTSNYEKRGDKYFKVYNYERALKEFLKAYKRDMNNVDLLQKIVTCYMEGNQLKDQAIPYLEHLHDLKPELPDVLFDLALAHLHAHEFDAAEEYLTKYTSAMGQRPNEKEQAERLRNAISNARIYVNSPALVELINVGDDINTSRSELSPFVTQDESVLFYSSDKRYNTYGGIYYFNVCVSEMGADDWEKPKTIGSTVNSGYDEIVAGISSQGDEVFVFHNRYKEETMAFAKYQGEYRFDILSDFGYPIDLKGGEFGVCMTHDKDTLFYAAEGNNGDTDLFYALRLPSGEWGESRPLPGKINSKYDENFPVYMPAEQRLYFSSNSLSSMGGYDLFYSVLDTVSGQWGEPVNLGYPINDTYDNYSISWVEGKRIGYVSAIRPEGYGNRDIYKVVDVEKDIFHLIYRCKLKVQTDSGLITPWFTPTVNVFDTLELKVGTYQPTPDSVSFLLPLLPGDYVLKVEDPQMEPLIDTISVSEKWYPATAREKQYIIRAKALAIESENEEEAKE